MESPAPRVPSWRWYERLLVGFGIVCLGWYGFSSLQGVMFRGEHRAAIERLHNSDANLTASTEAASSSPSASPSEPIVGLLKIPRLRFSELVAEGEAESTLNVAIGHLPDTPFPWQEGNSGLAGHRNTYFAPLKDIRIGDRVELATRHGHFQYRVTETLIVKPEDVWVLASTPTRTLTLVTCYPFVFVGRAPQRFVVRAESETTSGVVLRNP